MGTIFWDLDGTLTDPKPGITGSVIKALQDLGITAPKADDLEWVIGPALLWSFEKLGAPDPDAALAAYRRHYTTGGGMYDCMVYDRIPEVLDQLAQSHVMHIATAKPHAYARKITQHFGLSKHMMHEFGPELDGTRNDKAELLAHALKITKDDPARCVMIGDRHYDLKAAKSNNMAFIAVGWGYGKDDDLSDADAHVTTPDELPGAVNSILS